MSTCRALRYAAKGLGSLLGVLKGVQKGLDRPPSPPRVPRAASITVSSDDSRRLQTIPVPYGWSVEQAWEHWRLGKPMPTRTERRACIIVKDSRLEKVLDET
jgi:hypothetical protein